jgi:integrative and conjugative element protein (TIGR02256 family)
MNTNDIAFYNDYFEKVKGVVKPKDFQFNSEKKRFEGEIKFTSKKGEVSFLVQIPETYPLNELKFITKDFEGYPHQNFDGSLCLNTAFVNHLYTRLNLEIEKLRDYISKYYDTEKEDEHYEYSAFEAKGLVTLLFEETEFEAFRFKIPFGDFKFSVLSSSRDGKNKIKYLTTIAQTIGNKSYSWSDTYKKKDTHIGCWVFLDKEPVHKKKLRFTNWKDLAPYLPKDFSDYFRIFCKRSANYKLVPKGMEEHILLAIGYKIPNGKTYEVHWDLILLPRYDFPRKLSQSKQLIHCYNKPILWDTTFNASYDRFFGRGSIDRKIADRKILIIGNGAIGSSLAEILTRGGATKIDLADVENIEPGNICRSGFSFNDISFSKAEILREKLHSISPFIQVGTFDNLKATSNKSSDVKEVYEKLNDYEIIFDCTANNEIIQMLTDFHLPNTVFYLSISDNAKEMVCVCNADNTNIIERRNQMLYSFGNYHAAEFREGTGCWHPTFEASYFDINQLLNYTIRKINSFYKGGFTPKSFHTYFAEDIITNSEDIKYIQTELNLCLTIESDCLQKIEEYSRLHHPNEFGGILIGSYLNDYKELIISGIIYPDKFKSSPMRFEPDHKDLNKKLKQLHQEFEGKIEYVGDWHSHPNSNNQFSQPDFQSIQDIAKSKSVNTHNPILLVAAFGEDYFDAGFYVYHKNKLYKYKRKK